MIDIANHILSRISHQVPDEAAQLFEFLCQDQHISKESAEMYEKMVRFRNLVVNFYVDLKLNRVYEILQKNLSDFDRFIKDIQKILMKKEGNYPKSDTIHW